MKISDVIKLLEEEQKKVGDVELHTQQGDGRSSWISVWKPKLVQHKPWPAEEPFYELVHQGY